MPKGKALGAATKPRQRPQERTDGNNSATIGDNSQLTAKQRKDIFIAHLDEFRDLRERQVDLAEENKAFIKKAKAEGTNVTALRKAIKLESLEGRAEIEADIKESRQIAAWMKAPIGHQFAMLTEETSPEIIPS